ncbi:hypothetical protein [Actinoallomurus sp. NPDC050550]|uniref:hypothetical protein n=1 Tax=Actinoallomurus sp. NPDC050550 TaxID=3154937 RepID=UPI0033DE3841
MRDADALDDLVEGGEGPREVGPVDDSPAGDRMFGVVAEQGPGDVLTEPRAGMPALYG